MKNFMKKRAGFIEVNDDTPFDLTHELCFDYDFPFAIKKEVIEVEGKDYILAVEEEDCEWDIDDWGSK
jgi:hypothetical protein